MKERLPELSTDAQTLLEAGRASEPLPPGIAAQVWSKLAAGQPMAPPASTSLSPASAATFKTFALVKLVALSLGVLGIGALTTVAVVHLRARPPAPSIAPPPQEAAPAPDLVSIPDKLSPAPEERIEPSKVLRAAPPTPSRFAPAPVIAPRLSEATESDLEAERSLIARARSLLEGGSPLDALATLRVHEQRFRDGAFAQQREALRIEVLIASGNRPAAQAAAARFERDYPQSLMGPAVRATLRTHP